LQSVAEGECRRAYDTALGLYAASFDRSTPPEEGPLVSAHTAAVDAALAAFSREAVGSPELRQPFEIKLKAELAKQFKASHLTSLQQASSDMPRALSMRDLGSHAVA
jgi:hypothetical protein